MTTAVEEDTSAGVDTAQGGWEGEGAGREGAAVEGSEDGDPGRRSGLLPGAGLREEGEGREGEVAMSTSSEGEGLMEVVVECCSLREEGGAAGAWRGEMGERVRMV